MGLELSSLLDIATEPWRRATARYRVLPRVVIVGTQKGGTTSLFDALVQHPDMRPPIEKEVHYFDLHAHRPEGWYRGRFPLRVRLGHRGMSCEASPYYMVHPAVPRRLVDTMPEARIIMILRDPVARAFSAYRHNVRKGREPLSFEDAVDAEEERTRGEESRLREGDSRARSDAFQHYSYIRRGEYIDFIERWEEYFSRGRMLIIQSEQFFEYPADVFDQVLRFSGLTPCAEIQFGASNVGGTPGAIPGKMREKLRRHYEPYNERLYAWLGQRWSWE